jgi:hypothetical protein
MRNIERWPFATANGTEYADNLNSVAALPFCKISYCKLPGDFGIMRQGENS